MGGTLTGPNFTVRELSALRNRVLRAVEAFQSGEMILVGDDGQRENEADLVFHASAATTRHVNFALTHARGLLCVSVGHALADRLGFYSAPRIPGDISHTGFTLSVDARNNVTSGISAADRATSIRLMVEDRASSQDFISPGHVFPVRANAGGLLARTGHTEALLELCQLAGLPEAAAMCEVLGEDGDALSPARFTEAATGASTQLEALRQLPYLSTVDLLWYRLLCGRNVPAPWRSLPPCEFAGQGNEPLEVWSLDRGMLQHVSVPCAVSFFAPPFQPGKVRVVATNGIVSKDNGVARAAACAEVMLCSFHHLQEPLTTSIAAFCDLSAKEGLRSTTPSARRVVASLRAFEFLARKSGISGGVSRLLAEVPALYEDDSRFLQAATSA